MYAEQSTKLTSQSSNHLKQKFKLTGQENENKTWVNQKPHKSVQVQLTTNEPEFLNCHMHTVQAGRLMALLITGHH